MTQYIFDILLIILILALFGISHSYLASTHFKLKLKESASFVMPFYRLIYNLIALFSFYLVYELSPKPGIIIYELQYPYDLLILIPQFLSLAGLIWSVKYFSFWEFLGLNQIQRFFRKEYDISELDEKLTLRIAGPYKFTRHPVYFFSILFLVFRPVMSLFYLVFILCIIVYFYIGSFYEERKLLHQFGDQYKSYQKSVPRIVPYRIFSSYKAIGN